MEVLGGVNQKRLFSLLSGFTTIPSSGGNFVQRRRGDTYNDFRLLGVSLRARRQDLQLCTVRDKLQLVVCGSRHCVRCRPASCCRWLQYPTLDTGQRKERCRRLPESSLPSLLGAAIAVIVSRLSPAPVTDTAVSPLTDNLSPRPRAPHAIGRRPLTSRMTVWLSHRGQRRCQRVPAGRTVGAERYPLDQIGAEVCAPPRPAAARPPSAPTDY